jgi:RNA polymerase sigma-B factor
MPTHPKLEDATRREQHDLDLLRRYHDHHDLAARDELVARCLPLVASIARRYASGTKGEPLDDLIQAGALGLVKAIDRFDPSVGASFVAFAVPTIRGEIRRHFRDHTWAVHVPRSVQELDARIHAHRRTVQAETGREATPEELCEALDATPGEVAEALAAGDAYSALSLDQPDDEGRELLAGYGEPEPGYRQVDDHSVIVQALDVLDQRSRAVIEARFYDEELQRDIGERIGVSQVQVSRIIATSIDRMHRTVAERSGPLAA